MTPKVKHNEKIKFFTKQNPSLPNVDILAKRNLPMQRSDENLKELFPSIAFNTINRYKNNLKELLPPS